MELEEHEGLVPRDGVPRDDVQDALRRLAAGAELGDDYVSDNEALSASIERWLDAAGARAQDDPLADRDELPPTDPAVRGGADRGSSNASRTQSTVSDNPPVNDFMDEWTRGLQALATPQGWYRLFGMY